MSECLLSHCGSTTAVRGYGICDGCWDRRGRALCVISDLWHELHHHLPPGQRGLSEFVSHSGGGPRLPVNAAVLDAMHAIPRTLHQWASVARHLKGYCPTEYEGKRWSYVLSDAVIDLQAYDDELHYSEYGVDYLVSLFEAHGRMFSLAGLARLVHRLGAACPSCGRRELVRHNGQDAVLCARCGDKWSQPEYHRLTIVQTRTTS